MRFFAPRSFPTVIKLFMGLIVLFLGSVWWQAPTVQAATCNCTCNALVEFHDVTAGSCGECTNACRSYCEGLCVRREECAGNFREAVCAIAPTTVPTPSAPSSGRTGGGSSGSSRRSTTPRTSGGGSGGTTGAPTGDAAPAGGEAAPEGRCSYNCTTPRVTTCNTNDDCARACETNCPSLVANSTCATNPAAQCVQGSDGTKQCVFECKVAPPESCQVGDRGNSQCGSRCAAVCVPPPGGTGGARPAISCSTTLSPRCVDPTARPATSGGSAPSGEGQAEEGGAASSGSDSSGESSSSGGSLSLQNPIRGANTIPAIIGKGVRAFMGLVGAVALLMFVLGGIRWILSAGDQKEVQASSDMLKNAAIGLLIIFLSYTVITVGMSFVNELSTQGDPNASQGATNALGNSAPSADGEADARPPVNTTNRPSGGGLTNVPERPPTGGPTGTCTCAPTGLSTLLVGAASDEQRRQAEETCTAPPARGRFDRSSFTCTGTATEADCREAESIITRALPSGVTAGCTWRR